MLVHVHTFRPSRARQSPTASTAHSPLGRVACESDFNQYHSDLLIERRRPLGCVLFVLQVLCTPCCTVHKPSLCSWAPSVTRRCSLPQCGRCPELFIASGGLLLIPLLLLLYVHSICFQRTVDSMSGSLKRVTEMVLIVCLTLCCWGLWGLKLDCFASSRCDSRSFSRIWKAPSAVVAWLCESVVPSG